MHLEAYKKYGICKSLGLCETESLTAIRNKAFDKTSSLKPIESRAFVKICKLKPIRSMASVNIKV